MVFLELWWEIGVPLEVRWGPQGTSCIDTVESGPAFMLQRGTSRIPLEWLQGNRGPHSEVDVGNSRFLSSCDRDLGVPNEFQQGIRPRLVLRH